MQVYIEDRNGKKYFVERLTRREKIKLYNFSKMKFSTEVDLAQIEELFYKVLLLQNPSLTKEEYDDILDYNESLYGFNQLYELIGAFVEEVFTQVGGENTNYPVHPYLAEKKRQMEVQATEQEVQETPLNQPIY